MDVTISGDILGALVCEPKGWNPLLEDTVVVTVVSEAEVEPDRLTLCQGSQSG
jgi:hypothetical protein